MSPIHSTLPAPRIVFDYATFADEPVGREAMQQFLLWVENSLCSPRTVHLYLPTHNRDARLMKNKFQALGCTVTARMRLHS